MTFPLPNDLETAELGARPAPAPTCAYVFDPTQQTSSASRHFGMEPTAHLEPTTFFLHFRFPWCGDGLPRPTFAAT